MHLRQRKILGPGKVTFHLGPLSDACLGGYMQAVPNLHDNIGLFNFVIFTYNITDLSV